MLLQLPHTQLDKQRTKENLQRSSYFSLSPSPSTSPRCYLHPVGEAGWPCHQITHTGTGADRSVSSSAINTPPPPSNANTKLSVCNRDCYITNPLTNTAGLYLKGAATADSGQLSFFPSGAQQILAEYSITQLKRVFVDMLVGGWNIQKSIQKPQLYWCKAMALITL